MVLADPYQRPSKDDVGLAGSHVRSWSFPARAEVLALRNLIPAVDRLAYPALKDRACARLSVRTGREPAPSNRFQPLGRVKLSGFRLLSGWPSLDLVPHLDVPEAN
jgi:hypothetical protein